MTLEINARASTTKTVLIVDDNTDIVAILTRFITRSGMKALPAHTGRACLDIVQHSAVDVIVLDLMMPDMDGLQVCVELKKRALSIPIILLTARDDTATREAGQALGIDDFAAKPINGKDLLARIKALVPRTEVVIA